MCSRGCATRRPINEKIPAFAFPGRMFCLAPPVIILLFLSLMLCPLSWSAEPIVVSVTVNGVSKGDFFVVRDAGGGFLVRREDYA